MYERTIARRFPIATVCPYDVRRFESLEVLERRGDARDQKRYHERDHCHVEQAYPHSARRLDGGDDLE